MKVFILGIMIILSSICVNSSKSDIVPKITKITKDLISGIFVGVKGKTWVLPDTCLNQEFEDDFYGFMKHLKKFQSVYCFTYLHKIAITDGFYNCPADQIIFLYEDIQASIKSGQIYINSVINIKKIISLIVKMIKLRSLNSYDFGIFLGKLIDLTVYGKDGDKFFDLFNFSAIEIEQGDDKYMSFASEFIHNIIKMVKIDVQELPLDLDSLHSSSNNSAITKIFRNFEENKTNNPSWGFILHKSLEKYERSKMSSIAKKFTVFSVTSFELLNDFIQDFRVENFNKEKLYLIIELISNILRDF